MTMFSGCQMPTRADRTARAVCLFDNVLYAIDNGLKLKSVFLLSDMKF